MPDQGPVVEANSQDQVEDVQPPFSKPLPPQKGAAADDIVAGFLEAMIATPLTTTGASEYLTSQARRTWRPDQVLAYSTNHVGLPRNDRVPVRLHGTERVGSRGQWVGRVPGSAAKLSFPMEREDGEWRIANPPDALILPQTFFDQNYEDASLYYFDPTGRILVPEPVHVPQSSLASSLVRTLLRAPRYGPSSVTRTFIPPGLSVYSVPVTRSVAEVNLKGPDPGPLDQSVIKRILAQLSWTLRQDPSINAFTLTIAGRTITDAAGTSRFSVNEDMSDPFDPAVSTASTLFYALRHGRLVSGQVTRPSPVNGPFGTEARGIGPFAVNLTNTWVAGVAPDAVIVGRVLGDAPPTPVLSGPGLQRPAWDFAGRLWEVQNGSRGAIVVYLSHGRGRAHEVRVPGITGREVRRFLVSRDGSRIVAVLHGPTADHLVVSRLRYNARGAATRATRARRIPWESGGTTRIRDIGWTTPTTIAVLDRLSPAQAEVRILLVDGSTTPDQAPPRLVSGRVRGLATSPSQTPYAVLPLGVTDISHDTAQLDPSDQVPTVGLHHLTYAG